MSRPYRFLSTVVVHSSSTTVTESPDRTVESDFVIILAALLCALVCIVGLIAVAYCTWLQRRMMANRTPRQPSTTPNKGIEKKVVEALPKFAYDSKKEKGVYGECVICLVEYVDGDEIRVLPQCGHGFHIGCIDKWLGSHSSCPSCRQNVVIGKCKTCGEFPSYAAGSISLVVEHESGGSSSMNKVEGS
ncbi:putative transcription factor C2H2 family [Helianthus annuus]|uniref:Putative zinc finger, RING/FYVE/PHD-type n=1 Tax=Helianthus annuus TaxID=4232 RepID=A0A251SDI8_HELAN|nr:RING-H2 finger protein ATL80 [Helianthus annuus]KAF5765244.1 putative transcription factor C2H2 family [Helianthus annuus]KAJ0451796.1 putative transcription factor C2H2 family [Helianthus annuus]KAJ0456473.1 putative transcription factor C2H2 family [Helianthus annuus]KAJ0473685.1 putative transcription factor C2H2 family [Helianthus annuus]KAJ0649262.1 putative transcription factor C2H2 family [Helianthus annuus]